MKTERKRPVRVNRHTVIDSLKEAMIELPDEELKALYETYVDNTRKIEVT